MVREYLLFLDKQRDKPLALSTKSKRCGVIRQVLMLALEDGVIDIIPPMPKQRRVDKPRVSFTEAEYKLLLKTAREIADEGDTVVRGVPVTREHYHVIVFAVHSFLRPAETELFGIRFCDIETQSDPDHLLITLTGKTGYRKSATMPEAVDILQKVKEMYPDASPTDYVFMPQYPNRTTALNTYRRIFNHFLEKASLKLDKDGNPRSPYSLRHYALQTRLRKSEGEVNIYLLAKNAGTVLVSKRLAEQLKKFGKQYKSHVKRTNAPLIFSAKGGGFNAQTIINLFQKLYEEAGITGASSHSGRRQFVTELADKGINARVIQALARHKHLNTTMRYIDINENKMRAAIEQLKY